MMDEVVGRLMVYVMSVCGVFFFQAEDGIRDLTVTGVQTCALPICRRAPGSPARAERISRVAPAPGISRSRGSTLRASFSACRRAQARSRGSRPPEDRKSVV